MIVFYHDVCVCVCVCALSHLSCVWLFATYGLWSVRTLCPWDSPGKNTRVGCHALFQGIFPTHRLNPGLLHCRWALYHLSNKERVQCRGHGFSPWFEKIPWRRAWQPTPVFLPGESHGQRSLAVLLPIGSQRIRRYWAHTGPNSMLYPSNGLFRSKPTFPTWWVR